MSLRLEVVTVRERAIPPGWSVVNLRGLLNHIRHPQYTGFLTITLGMLFEWATLPLLIMWPILAVLYYRLARQEEADMENEFGATYLEYKQRTGMFLPRLSTRRTVRA